MTIQLNVAPAERLQKLPPYLFVEIDRKKREAAARGMDIINMGIGDPDLPTPDPIVQKLAAAADKPPNHRYPDSEGMPEFRQAVSEWYQRRFDVALNSEDEIISLIGAKEGIGHLPLALVDPGDVTLVPDPAYPVYEAGTVFAGGDPYRMPLLASNRFLPDLKAIPSEVLSRAKILFVNYPNNPTGAVASLEFFEEVVEFASKHGIVVAHDATYSEIAFDGHRPFSFLQVEGAKDVGIEFHSLSKTFNMTGWRIGMAVGNPQVLAALGSIKSNLDSGAFQAVQEAGIAALAISEEVSADNSAIYQVRRDTLVDGLREMGMEVEPPRASFYVWPRVPAGHTSASLVADLIDKAGIVCTPGSGFGAAGEGFVRFALTTGVERLREGLERMKVALS